MNERNRLIAKFLHMLLVACVKHNPKAAIIVKAVTDRNGWLAWRRLNLEFQPRHSDRWTAMEASLMNPPKFVFIVEYPE